MDIHLLRDNEYDALTALRAEAFDDDREYIDMMNVFFGDDIRIYMLTDDNLERSSLTQFRMGDLILPGSRLPASVSYAICTDERSRGMGYGAAITFYARDLAAARGDASILTPANPGLIDFYQPLGYRSFFYVEDREAVAHPSKDPDFRVEQLSSSGYGTAREKMLAGRIHIRLSGHTLDFVKALSLDQRGLYRLTMHGRTAFCACADDDDDWLFISELLTASDDPHDPADYAAAVTDHLGKQACRFRTPASCDS